MKNSGHKQSTRPSRGIARQGRRNKSTCQFFKKIKDVGDACSGMSGVANTCMNFASDIAQDTCYNCCMGIYNSYGNEIGGIGYFVCHNICSEF